MAKVVRNIELTEEESQILVKAYDLVRYLANELDLSSVSFFDKLDDMCSFDDMTTGSDLNGKIIEGDYDDYEFKIVDK
jgi:hypothetical protein